MEDKKYNKLKASFEATQPQIPADFTGRVMKCIEQPVHVSSHRRLWPYAASSIAAAACIAFVLMMVWLKQGIESQDVSPAKTASLENLRQQTTETKFAPDKPSVRTERTIAKIIQAPKTEQHENRPHEQTEEDPNLHYAVHEQSKDTLPYQAPARVDEFISKMADYYNVREGELTCSVHADSNVVSSVYVFPDKQEINLFNRLLQVACWYSDETPGYLLNFSHRQFFFELKDIRQQLQYRWIAERINGKILLYGTNAPIGAETSSACYQEYRDELMHTRRITPKTRDI
ncbi:MAG: hypothetical protein II864_00110 [Prevotella sp.]|nr:hypothetical protein [Prevotella sp.]MBR0049319.1 hypothetical protein [Prevotella sp.]MBR0268912.1 hypothetical protein [Prevotella sp.]